MNPERDLKRPFPINKLRWRQGQGNSGELELTNLEVVQRICQHLDRIQPRVHGKPYSELISFVEDRPGHDFRYAIDSSLIRSELGWTPQENFEKELVDLIYDNMETL